jgi:hypothetical protein
VSLEPSQTTFTTEQVGVVLVNMAEAAVLGNLHATYGIIGHSNLLLMDRLWLNYPFSLLPEARLVSPSLHFF